MEDNAGEDEDSLYSLFINEDYKAQTWTFQAEEITLLCSGSSSTDHDLTGQIVWPASIILAWFIHHNRISIFSNCRVLELGAGCGLGGFFAAKCGSDVTLTDGNNIVVKLLARNVDYMNLEKARSGRLWWGLPSEVQVYYDNILNFPEVIIGADIILWPDQVHSLLITLLYILSMRRREELQEGVAYISYVVRANTTTDLFFSTADRLQLDINEIPTESFIPPECREFDRLTKKMLKITLRPSISLLTTEDFEQIEIETKIKMENVSMPC